MTDLHAEMTSECSRAIAVAAHDVSWMLWNTCTLFMLNYAVMFSSFLDLGGDLESKGDRLRVDIVT